MNTRKQRKPENEWVVVKKSPIHGLGVFAKTTIHKHTKIADYYGKEMKWKSFTKKYGPYKTHSLHTYPMRRIWKILVAKEEPYKSQNLTNYINESDRETKKSNCELKMRGLYAKKNIRRGEELLLDYPKDYHREWTLKKKTQL